MLAINVTKITALTMRKETGETFKTMLKTTKHREGTLENAFSMYVAYLIVKKVQGGVRLQQVNGQPMKSVYKPLSKAYNKSKPKATQDKFWKNSDYLIKHLKIWRNRASIFVGYPYSAKHPDNRSNLTNVMKYNEFGTKLIQARPLFKPIISNIIKNPNLVLTGFLKTISSNGGVIPPELYIGA